jgi:hypothetical protein
MGSIVDARAEIDQKMTPTLRRDVENDLPRIFKNARRQAVLGLAKFKEAAAASLPQALPYSLDDLLGDDWYPANRHGIEDPDDPA